MFYSVTFTKQHKVAELKRYYSMERHVRKQLQAKLQIVSKNSRVTSCVTPYICQEAVNRSIVESMGIDGISPGALQRRFAALTALLAPVLCDVVDKIQTRLVQCAVQSAP